MLRDTKIIGVAGYKRSGKDTVGEYLEEEHFFQTFAFADPMKDMLFVLGVEENYLWGDDKEVPCEALGGKTSRHALQTLGTEWGRNVMGEDFWASATLRRVDKTKKAHCVITDVRFDNEARLIKKMGGEVWQVVREDVNLGDVHPSERGVSSALIDKIILNDGTLEELHEEIEECLKRN